MTLTKYGTCLIIASIILVIAGITFTMQSNSVVGPSSSFMHDNPKWTSNGFIIIGIGMALAIIGIIVYKIEKNRRTASK
jgi:uncharacterized membrane protein